MSDSELASGFSLPHCSVVVTRKLGALTVAFTGNFDLRAIDAVKALLPRVHKEALATALSEVVVDVRSMEFMTSACFKSFVTWLNDLQSVDGAKQYKIRFLASEKRHWQRASLVALSSFAVGLVHVES